MQFDYVWLRDTCRSAVCYNPKTSQRMIDTASIDLNIRPADTKVTDGHLVLTCKSCYGHLLKICYLDDLYLVDLWTQIFFLLHSNTGDRFCLFFL